MFKTTLYEPGALLVEGALVKVALDVAEVEVLVVGQHLAELLHE